MRRAAMPTAPRMTALPAGLGAIAAPVTTAGELLLVAEFPELRAAVVVVARDVGMVVDP
jgi:hypothetical protein